MTGGHLGERAAALVDGELGHDARDRALAHLAICADCRAEVEAQRRLKARLAGLVDCPVPAGLLTRLVALAEPGEPLPPRTPRVPGSSRPATVAPPARFATGSPRRQARPTRSTPTRPSRQLTRSERSRGTARTRLAAATLVVVAVTMTTAFALGDDPSSSAPLVRPAVDRYAAEHASAVSGVPLTDPAITVVSAAVTGNLGSSASPAPAESPAPMLGPDAHDPVLVEAGYLDTARS